MNTSTLALLKKHFDLAIIAPDGIKRLRELILTLAMQGKLVPQDPKDQPACELLKEIEAEKKRLVKEGKIKEPKPLPAIKAEDVPYAVPKGWEWVRLGDFTQIIRGITFPSGEKTKEKIMGRIACLRTTNVQNEVEWEDLLFIDRKYMTSEQKLLEINDIVISMANSRELVGKVAIVRYIPHEEATFGGFLAIIRTYKVLALYLQNILRSNYSRSTLIDSSSQTTNIANISLEKLNPLLLPLPPLAEQKRIVAKIDQLMVTCDALEQQRNSRQQMRQDIHSAAITRLLDATQSTEDSQNAWDFLQKHFGELYSVKENVAELRKAILQLAVMGKLVRQDPKDQPACELLKEIEEEKKRLVKEGKIKASKLLPEIKPEDVPYLVPKGWEWVRLGELIDLISGQHLTPSEYNETGDGFSYYTGPADFGLINPVATRWTNIDRAIAVQGDILITVKGAGVGKTNIVNESKVAISRQLMALRVIGISDRFLLRYLSTIFYELQALAVGIAIPGIGRDDILFRQFPLPPLAEQKRIVAKIDELMSLCDKLEQGIDNATIKQSAILEAVVAQV